MSFIHAYGLFFVKAVDYDDCSKTLKVEDKKVFVMFQAKIFHSDDFDDHVYDMMKILSRFSQHIYFFSIRLVIIIRHHDSVIREYFFFYIPKLTFK